MSGDIKDGLSAACFLAVSERRTRDREDSTSDMGVFSAVYEDGEIFSHELELEVKGGKAQWYFQMQGLGSPLFSHVFNPSHLWYSSDLIPKGSTSLAAT